MPLFNLSDDPRYDDLDHPTRRLPSENLLPSPQPSPSNSTLPGPRLLTRHQLRALVPYSPQHILRLEKRGQFPRRVRVGSNRVAWLASEIEAWIALRVGRRDDLGER